MDFSLRVALCLSMLALCLAIQKEKQVRWCVKSNSELKKCKDLVDTCKNKEIKLSCVEKSNTDECSLLFRKTMQMQFVWTGGDVYKGSLQPYNLKPIMAENYGSHTETDTCYYAVAVVKKSSKFTFDELKDKKSCHTGIGKTAGWNIIIGLLLERKLLKWAGPDSETWRNAVSKFFKASCVPGAKEPKLSQLCAGIKEHKCSRSNNEPYYNYAGAFKCLQDDQGDVAFVKQSTVPEEFHKDYELLCPDNTRKSIKEYKNCNLAKVPAHAVLTRGRDDKSKDIIEFLQEAQKTQECKLFRLPGMGKGSNFQGQRSESYSPPIFYGQFSVPRSRLFQCIQALKEGVKEDDSAAQVKVRWCTQSKAEKTKCDDWTTISGGAIECTEASTAEECIVQILKGDADAVTLDGGYMYTAGLCGLVPVMGEYYDQDDLTPCQRSCSQAKGVYYAVAIVKKGTQVSWSNLRGVKTCHTAVGRTAGWNIPVGLITSETANCDFASYVGESCAPGSDVKSNLCALCIGDPEKLSEREKKCSPSASEAYYGYSGAFRCLVEKGQVGFAKHTTVFENTDGKNPAGWAKDLKSEDFELLCPDGSRAPVTDYKRCNLAEVPAHAVVTLPDKREQVAKIVVNQQSLYGRKGFQKDIFQMFQSTGGKDLLFKDSTQCLLEIPSKTTMQEFLGDKYHTAVTSLNKCSTSNEASWLPAQFHSCMKIYIMVDCPLSII
ncbi:serotransferrin-A precursor [Xenopus laevis]|uniref:serotransferrin-A precursor n=1 Tax=Xenopus laevis TaxID=8355 RepID=UPI00001715AD|nr:serotransferrin-A precursor [Xenopus laevis]CAA38396.1 precursor peptide [Xenopus laevis]